MAHAFCTHCGRPLKEGDRFCTNCGTPVRDAPASRQEQLQSAQPAEGDTAVMPPVRDPDDSPASDASSGARSSESAGSGKAVSTKTAVLIITAVAAVIVVAALILIHPWAHDDAIPATSSSASQETAASMANGEQGAESASSSSGSSSSAHAHSASKGKGSSRSSSYRLTTKTAGARR